METTDLNYYHLTKKELSFFSKIEKPLTITNGKRVSKPIVCVFYCGNLLHVWSLKWFKNLVKESMQHGSKNYVFEIRVLY